MADLFNSDVKNDFENNTEPKTKNPYEKYTNIVNENKQARLENRDKYGVELTDKQYAAINNIIAQAPDQDEESYKIATALKISENTKIPFTETYANLDGYLSELYGNRKDTSYRNAFSAIGDTFTMGKNNVRIGELGNLIREATNKGDTESVEIYKKEYEQLKKSNELLADNAPRTWGTKAIEAFAQSAPFMAHSSGAALFGNLILPGVGGFVGTMYTTAKLTAGEEYLSLIDEGIDPDIAERVSGMSAALQGVIEGALDTVTAGITNAVSSGVRKTVSKTVRQEIIDKVTNTVQKKFHFGAGGKLALRIALDYASAIPNEMLEEATQNIVSDVSGNIAARQQNERILSQLEELKNVVSEDIYQELVKENLIDEKSLREIVNNTTESAKSAFLATLVSGVFSTGLDTAAAINNMQKAQGDARNIPSFEVYKKVEADNPVFENFKDEIKKENAMREVWEKQQRIRDKKDAEVLAGIGETTAFSENMEEAPEENDEGEIEYVKAARDNTGRLFTEKEVIESDEENGKETSYFKVGNEKAGGKLYGFIKYTEDENNNTVTINEFKMTSYRRALTQEVFDEFAQEHADQDIIWNPVTKSGKELKEALINNNFSGKNNGLNYYTQVSLIEADTRRNVAKQIRKSMPTLNGEQVAAAVSLLEAGARRQGKTLSEYVQGTFAGGQIFGRLNEIEKQITQEERGAMKGASGWRSYGNETKAVIYAAKNADFSTFAHEVAHIWQAQLTGDLKAEAEKAFNVKDGDWRNSTFTFADGHTESSAEAFARGFEQYLNTGKAPDAKMKNLFQKFAEFLYDVYKTLKQFITMTPEIESVYDKLMDADDSVMKNAEKAVIQADREHYAQIVADREAKEAAEKKAQEEAKQAEEQSKQDTKEEESEITLNDEKSAEPDLTPLEEGEEETESETKTKTEEAVQENEESTIPPDLFFQKMEKTLEDKGVKNAKEVIETIQDKAATITEKVKKADEAVREIYFQLIGEQGAAALDKAEEATTRLDNLKIAREMTKAGKDAKAIRYATGWEKGKDGLWRYEIADDYHLKNIKATNEKLERYEKQLKKAKEELKNLTDLTDEQREIKRRNIAAFVKHNALPEGTTLESMIEDAELEVRKAEMLMEYDTYLDVEKALKRLIERGINPKDFWDDMGESFYLPKLIDNKELFAAYPELEKVTIAFARYDMDGHMGSYDHNENSITMFPAGMRTYKDFRSVLAHEVQHAIQRIEGFAVGGSVAQFEEMEAPSKVQEAIMLLDDIPMNELMNYKQHDEFKFIKENLPEVLEENIDGLGTLEQIMDNWIEDVKSGIFTIQNVYDEIQNARKAYNKYNRLNEYANEKTARQKYESLAGEVEARNVQNRMRMTAEERLNTLLTETADVAPEEQIVLFDGMTDSLDLLEIDNYPEKNYPEYKGKGQEAINFLINNKSGQVKGAFNRQDIGDIDIVWGKIIDPIEHKGYGIVHIIDKHGIEAALNLGDIIINGEVSTNSTNGRIAIEKDGYRVAIRRTWDGSKKTWVVTGFKLEKENSSNPSAADNYTTATSPKPNKTIQQENAGVNNIQFQKVYHGSGASFDRFNTEQYGLSGEGSMSFGYGAYVTDSEEIARDYAERQAFEHDKMKLKKEFKDYDSILFDILALYKAVKSGEDFAKNKEQIVRNLKNDLENKKTSKYPERFIQWAENDLQNFSTLNSIEDIENLFDTMGRNLYTVEIPDDGYLDWFETVSKSNRSKIADLLFSKIIELDEEGMYKGAEKELKAELNSAFESDTDGSHLYGTLIDYLGSDKEASQFLHSIGFAGIKYPAGTNYGNGNGAYNYVIFNDDEARIVEHLQFQTMEELYNEARGFESWQEFMEYEQDIPDWVREGAPNPIPSEADAEWYENTWRLAKGMDQANEMQEEDQPNYDTQEERTKDALFATKMENPGQLERFLEEIDYINKADFEEMGAPESEDEALEYARIERLKDYIHNKLRHGSWLSNATRIANGKELTPQSRKRLITLINLNAREYRDIYTEITGNQEFAVPEEERYFTKYIEPYAKKVNRLLTPEEALAMSPEQLRQLADSLSDEISNKEIAEKIKNGTLKMDDELKNYIKKLDRRVKLAEERYSKLEKDTKADYTHINDFAQRRLLDTYDELLRARAKLNNKKNLLDKKIVKGLKLTERYQREVQGAQATYDEIFKAWNNLTAVNKISAEVQEAMKRKEEYIAAVEETAKLKNDKAILTQISDMRKKLVKSAMRRVPFERINYEQAKTIIAIQRILYPNLKGDVNKWIGERSIYIKGVVSEYLTNAEVRDEIDKSLSRKRAYAQGDGTKNRIEALQIMLKQLKKSDDVDQWDIKKQNLFTKFIPQSTWAKELNLEALEEERGKAIQLDISYTEEHKIVKGKDYTIVHPQFSEEIRVMVQDALGADLFNQLMNKPFEDWTTSEMEKFTKRIDEIYREGRDRLAEKRQAQKDIANELREQIRNAVRETGIEFKDTDTPEEREEKLKKIDRILGNDSIVKGTFGSKKDKSGGRFTKLFKGYNTLNVRRFARILDGYNEGTNTQLLFFYENDCYVRKMTMLRKRNEKISNVLKAIKDEDKIKSIKEQIKAENEKLPDDKKLSEEEQNEELKKRISAIDLQDLYKTIEVDGNSYSVDDLLYILAADQDYELTETKDGKLVNDDYAPTARNAVMFGNLGSQNELLEQKEALKRLDEATKERFANGDFTEEEQKAIKDGFAVSSIPGTQEYIAQCHNRYDRVLQAAKDFLKDNPKFERLLEAIDADYTEQFERMQQVSIEEFNAPVFRVKKYVPLNRMESNGDTNENRVREDLLATSGAGTGKNYVDKGMTQKRRSIGPLNQKPVEMGLYKTWADATERTEHFINYAPYVRELNRVYKSRDAQFVRRFIENKYGKPAVDYIDNYIAEIANPDAAGATDALDQIVHTLRGKTAPAYLAWKASAIIKQAATSPWPYMQFVNPKEYLKANFDILKSKCKLYDEIKQKSVYMANRVMDPMIDLIKEQQEKATNPAESFFNKFNAIGMQGLEMIDWVCVAPGWLACYNKKLNELQKANDIAVIEAEIREENERLDPSNPDRMTNDQIKAEAEARALSVDDIEEQAVLYADDCTRLCQPSNRAVDLAPLFKRKGPGSEVGKAFLQFQTSLNVIWQNLRFDLPYALRQKQFKQIIGMIFGYTLAGITVGAITEGFRSDEDDEDKEKIAALRKFIYYSTTQFTDAIPVIGGIVSNLDNKWIGGNKGFMSANQDLLPMFTKAINGTASLTKGNWEKALWNYGEAAGLFTGLPVSGTKELLRVAGIGDNEKGLDFKPESVIGRRD